MKKKKCFHDGYIKKIVNLIKEDRLEEAICELEKYIANYPNDLAGYNYLANTYMSLGDFKAAEKIFEKATAIITNETSEKGKEMLTMFKIKMLCYQNRYSECLETLIKNKDVYFKNEWLYFGTILFLKKQLGILTDFDYKMAKGKYLLSQIVSYDENEAISHIEKHLESSDDDTCVKFVENFSLRDIFFKLRKTLPLNANNKIYKDDISNEYVFKYISNGHVGSKLVDYFIVITIKDTNEIITMCPYENKARRPYIDITPIQKEKIKPKVKRLSQIDKFNQRYSKCQFK